MEILSVNHDLVQDSTLSSTVHSSVSRDPSVSEVSSAKESPDQSLKFNKYWNTTSKFLRPRILCLEHAVQIVKMLQCKGGANVLILCHLGLFTKTVIFALSFCYSCVILISNC